MGQKRDNEYAHNALTRCASNRQQLARHVANPACSHMNLQNKITTFFVLLVAALVAAIIAIGLFSFRQYSIKTAKEHIGSSAEIVRVALTEAMINGAIAKREGLLERLMEVPGLKSVRVVRSPMIEGQFGKGLLREQSPDAIEQRVLGRAKPAFELLEGEFDTTFRGTIPYIATARGSPNCLQCHQVPEGAVLGAVTITMSIENLRRNAMMTLGMVVAAVLLFSLGTMILLWRLTLPIVSTARSVEGAVRRAIEGDFDARVEVKTSDEIGKIAADMNSLLAHLDRGLNHIGRMVEQLTNRRRTGNNLLTSTIQMVETLTQAAHFKQAIEEDETKAQIYARLSGTLERTFGVKTFSIYEVSSGAKQMIPIAVDGAPKKDCRWGDPLTLARNESCRACRTGRSVDAIATPNACGVFTPEADDAGQLPICLPIMQSGGVGAVVQLLIPAEDHERVSNLLPDIGIYLREAAPVLEAKRLMETLRESTLRDPLTGLYNRRFLEDSVELLIAQTARRQSTVALMMLDIDFFKSVNDTHGHDAGDAVLRGVADVIKGAVRITDSVIRFGGEEFLILLQDTTVDSAMALAEKIRLSIQATKFHATGGMLQKTISIGVSQYPGDNPDFWQAVKCADLALYHAKASGRNRVVRFTGELAEVVG